MPETSIADTRVTPEYSLYKTHSNIFRSRFAVGGTWKRDSAEFTTAAFEYDLDVGLGSFFRRYVFKDPDVEKSKFLTIRLGYAYIPDLTTGNDDADEQRGITDFTLRLPIGKAWLLSDRNRADFRHFTDSDSVRYRNRLRLERNVAWGGFRVTPYVYGEAYYDAQSDVWNQADGTAGLEFPWRHSTIMELYFTWQFRRAGADDQVVGITLQKHL